jgi:uncharacterized protein (TIRG00374 family)
MDQKSRYKKIHVIIGILILCGLFYFIDWKKLTVEMKGSNWLFLLPYFIFLIFHLLLRSIRLLLLGNSFQTSYIVPVVGVLSYTYLLGVFTPGRIGEFARIWPMQKFGISKTQGVFLYFLERAFDVTILAICGFISLIHLKLGSEWHGFSSILLQFIIVLGGMLFVYGFYWKLAEVIKRTLNVTNKYFPGKIYLTSLFTTVQEVNLTASPRIFTYSLLLTLMIQVSAFVQLHFLYLTFHHGLPWYAIITGYTTSIIISWLPISFAGLGTRELFYITYLQQFGINKEIAITISLLDGFVLPIITTSAVTALMFIFRSSSLKKQSS